MTEVAKLLRDAFNDHPYVASSVVTLGLGYLLLRMYVGGRRCKSKARLDGKFVIITGANTGIGKMTVIELLKRGAKVMMACRDPHKGSEASKEIFEATGKAPLVKTLDLASLASVRAFARDINKMQSNVDILINNAGVMGIPKRKESQDGYELQFATNHLGHFLLTNMLLDVLKSSAPSRIVNVSAKAYIAGEINFDDINLEKNYGPIKAYMQSKLANILFTKELSRRLEGSNVTVNCLHPGVIVTDLGRNVEAWVPIPLRIITLPLFWLIKQLLFKDPLQGVQTTLHCVLDPDLHNVSGEYFSDCEIEALKSHATDEASAKRLWDVSAQMVDLSESLQNSS